MTAPIVELRFPAPAERLTMNQRLHWSRRAALTRDWRTIAHITAHNWRMDKRHAEHSLPACAVKVTFAVPDKRRRDPHNTAPTVKAIIDGLVDAKFWRDDTPDQVAVLDPEFTIPAPQRLGWVWVECWPLLREGAA